MDAFSQQICSAMIAAIAFETAFLKSQLNENSYQVVQAIAGRTRIRIPWLRTNEEAAGKLQRLVESLSSVTSVRINPLAQSIVILYRAQAISPKELEAQVASAIQQANPTPNAPVSPGVSPTPAVAAPASVEPPLSVSSAVGEPTANSASAQTVSRQPGVEVPSPWDDPPEVNQKVEPKVEQGIEAALGCQSPVSEENSRPEPEISKSVPAAAESVSVSQESSLPLHSTASLAKRLNTTSQAITHRRNRLDFPTWTQSQDPERIAWKYDAASQSFRPADAIEVTVPVAPAAISTRSEQDTGETSVMETSHPAPAEELPSPAAKKRKKTRKSTKSTKPTSR